MNKEMSETLTRVGPETRMGNLLRRYWVPALMSSEIAEPDGPQVRVQLLGEKLLAFRNTDGQASLISEFCSHRGVSLFFGRNEENGIRCAYHGLKFNSAGQCVDVPSAPQACARMHIKGYTRTLAFEEAPHSVRANAVCPGSTLTDFHVGRAQGAGKNVEQLKTERKDTSLIGRWADPIEIARPILWLASSEASFITGTTLMVDGGLHIM